MDSAQDMPSNHHLWFPPELCDSILDVFAPPSLDIPYTADSNEDERIRTVRTCALVCRSWLPRARFHLYHTIWISNGPSLLKLCTTLASCKRLVPLINRIVAARGAGTSFDMPAQGYFPFHAFFAHRPPIASVVLEDFWWDESEYPMAYRARIVPHDMPIVRLQLTGVIFPSLRGMFQLIRRFAFLVHLSVISATFDEEPSELGVMRMQALRPCWAASSLRTLEVGAPGPGSGAIPGVNLLGDQIEHFRAVLAVKDPSAPLLSHYTDCVSKYASLKSLRITLQPALGFQNPLPRISDEGARVWGPVHDALLSFMSAVRSPLDTLKISILAQRRDEQATEEITKEEEEGSEKDRPWEHLYRYRTSRSDVLNILFAPDVRDMVLSHPLSHLTTLQFVICDNSREHGVEWWTPRIQERIPGLRSGVMRTEVQHCIGREYALLWEETPPASAADGAVGVAEGMQASQSVEG